MLDLLGNLALCAMILGGIVTFIVINVRHQNGKKGPDGPVQHQVGDRPNSTDE